MQAITFPWVRLEHFEDEDFLRHARKFVKRIGDAGAAHVDRFVALVGMLRIRELNANRYIARKV